MGDMASGGAPRTKNIVERLTEIAGAISNGQMSTSLRDGTGSEIGTPSNPLIVDIGGEVPDTLDLARVAGAATAVGAGVANPGTIRVVNASDDVNLSGILSKLDTELSTRASEATLAAQLDITLSALRDALRGTGSKDFTTLEADAESILAQLDVDLSTRASEATLAAQLDITQSALRDALKGIGGKDLTTLQTALDAVQVAVEKIDDLQDATVAEGGTPTKGIQISLDNGTTTTFAQCDANGSLKTVQRGVPVKTVATGSGAIATSYAPSAAFWLDAITVHLSAAPTTAENLTVTLDAVDGADYDTVVFSTDPSTGEGATDICFIPLVPIPCVTGDGIMVQYANTDAVTYGVRILAREM